MGNHTQPTNNTSDEIDFGQLFQAIGNGFRALFKGLLMFFVYIKKNLLVLGGLLILGTVVGFALNFAIEKKLMTEVIVKPNFESKDYLYDVVDEVQSNLKSKDTVFFKKIGIVIEHLKGFEVSIEPIQDDQTEQNLEDDMEYLDLLQNFKDQSFAINVIKSELFKKTVLNHRLNFTYENAITGQDNLRKILAYLNSNAHFNEVGKVARENIRSRIEKNTELIGQVDELITNYSKGLVESDRKLGESQVYLEKEGGLNVPSLLTLKNKLATEIEEKKLELVTTNEVVSIINIGNSQVVKKQFFKKSVVLIPLLLVGLFFLISVIRYLNKKAVDLNIQ